MITIFKPKHTLQTVALEIQSGLKEEYVFLNDQALNEAGYEIHETRARSLYNFLNYMFYYISPIIYVTLLAIVIIKPSDSDWVLWFNLFDISFLILLQFSMMNIAVLVNTIFNDYKKASFLRRSIKKINRLE